MDSDKILLSIAVVAFIVSIVAAGFTYLSVADYTTKLSGLVTGQTNLTVEVRAAINFTTDTIDWGSGLVDEGQDFAVLDTQNNDTAFGNWTAQGHPLNIQNIGNVNVSLNISGGKTAATFLGGTNPAYQWNVSGVGVGAAGSCLNSSGNGQQAMPNLIGVFYDVNTTANTEFCPVFQFVNTADNVTIHFNITVPSDSFTGALGDVITAEAFVI